MGKKLTDGRKAGSGRQKGSVGKTTARVRHAIAHFADTNVDQFTGWIMELGEDDPKSAAQLFLQALEYHIPKLARTEVDAQVDQKVVIEVMSAIGAPPNSATLGDPPHTPPLTEDPAPLYNPPHLENSEANSVIMGKAEVIEDE